MEDVALPRANLGQTGLSVSVLGLGLAALGRPAYITLGRDVDLGPERGTEAMERRCHHMLDAAYRAGIRYVDAARSYGLAEAFLASWLRQRALPVGSVVVGSKWGYRYEGNWRIDAPVQEVKDHSLGALRRQWQESIDLLGAQLRLYQVHSATLESGVLGDRLVLQELARLRESGVAIGLTVSGPHQTDVIRRALEVEVDGTNPFQTVQATYNVLEPSAGSALAEANEAGWGVLVKEVLANGRLSTHDGGPISRVLGDIAVRRGASIDQVAFAAVTSRPWATVVLSGAVTGPQLDSNCASLSVSLSEQDHVELGRLAESPEGYWQRRAALPWH